MQIHSISGPISDAERAALLFSGDIIIQRRVPAMRDLIAFSDQLLRDALAVDCPAKAHLTLAPEAFLNRSCQAQKLFRTSARARALFFEALKQCGLDTANTYYDHFPMRVVPCSTSHQGAHRSAIGHHRDTWGSNISAQQNWWAPIYTIEPQRSIALYPQYWSRGVANTTDSWSFDDYLATRAAGVEDRHIDYPSAPQCLETIDEQGAVKIALEPGDILNFASAQLHASVVNTTQSIRYSVEMRTLGHTDLQCARTAPNVDNLATTPMYPWFKHIESGEKANF
ncbi:MAG: hypothetical protein ACPG4U_07160 [Pseudomonadales bacterium]